KYDRGWKRKRLVTSRLRRRNAGGILPRYSTYRVQKRAFNRKGRFGYEKAGLTADNDCNFRRTAGQAGRQGRVFRFLCGGIDYQLEAAGVYFSTEGRRMQRLCIKD